MKKKIVAGMLFAGILFLVGSILWMNNLKAQPSLLGNSVYAIRNENKGNILYDVNGLMVIKKNDSYSVFFNDGGALTAEAVFDQDGSLTSCANITPVKATAFSERTIQTRREMQRYLGAPHVDIGSGQYLPTYLLDDGRLVTFQYADENVVRCTVRSIVDMEAREAPL